MKNLKKAAPLLLAAALLLGLFAGCSGKTQPEQAEQPADLTFYFYDTFTRGSKAGHIEEVARQIVQDELGITVDILWIAPMQWSIRSRSSSPIPKKRGHFRKIFKCFFIFTSILFKFQQTLRVYYTIRSSEKQGRINVCCER